MLLYTMRHHIHLGHYHGKGIHLKDITNHLFYPHHAHHLKHHRAHLSHAMKHLGLGSPAIKKEGGLMVANPHIASLGHHKHAHKKLVPLKFKF